MSNLDRYNGKFYTKLGFIICMCVLMPPFGIFLSLFFKNPRTIKRRILLVLLTICNWGIWLILYSKFVLPAQGI